MIGMLSAIPKTPLHARLAKEGRLDRCDEPEFGTNVIPLRLSREELRDGYTQLMVDVYEPATFFDRLEDLYLREKMPYNQAVVRFWKRHPLTWLTSQIRNLATCVVLYRRLMRGIPEASLRREYRRRLGRFIKARPDPNILIIFLFKCAMHYHQFTMAKQMATGRSPIYNSI
jgi:hypothetical protein